MSSIKIALLLFLTTSLYACMTVRKTPNKQAINKNKLRDYTTMKPIDTIPLGEFTHIKVKKGQRLSYEYKISSHGGNSWAINSQNEDIVKFLSFKKIPFNPAPKPLPKYKDGKPILVDGLHVTGQSKEELYLEQFVYQAQEIGKTYITLKIIEDENIVKIKTKNPKPNKILKVKIIVVK